MKFFKRRRTAEQRKHVAGLLRLLGFAAGVSVVCGALQIRAAKAEVANEALNVGRQMVQLAKTPNTDVTPVSVNGQHMFVGSSLSKEPVNAVLDRYESHCKANNAQSADSWKDLASKTNDEQAAKADFLTSGVMRSGTDFDGTVLCFVKGPNSKSGVIDAFKAFGETGDLGAVGELRYVYAQKTKKGNTHILTGWTAQKFNLKEMTPEDDTKDVPGEDFAEIPRPEGGRRVLSARIQGTPFGVNTYTTDMEPGKVAIYYDELLRKQGWNAIDVEVDEKLRGDNPKKVVGHLYEKDAVVMTLAAHVDQGKTFATLGLAGVQSGDTANR